MTTLSQILFTKQFDVNQFYPELDNLTPIMFAAKHGLNSELCKILSKLNKDSIDNALTKVNNGGLTPLHFAAMHGHAEIIQSLLNYGASPLIETNLEQLPVHSVFHAPNNSDTISTIVNILITANKKTISIPDKNGETIAHLAANFGVIDVLKTLYTQDATLLSARNEKGQSPLLVALLSNRLDVAKYLLKVLAHKAIQQPDNNGKNALHYAAIYGDSTLLKEVMPHFHNLDLVDNEKNTALNLIIKKQINLETKDQQLKKMEVLLSAGVKLNIEANSSELPLHTAVLTLDKDLVDCLLTYGADINISNSREVTPLFMLFLKKDNKLHSQEFSEMVLYLLEQGASLHVSSIKEGSLCEYLEELNLPNSLRHLNSSLNLRV